MSENYWNRVAGRYDSLYGDVYSALENATVSRLLRRHFQSVSRVLDVGCGTGLGRDLLPSGIDYAGCDPAPNMLRLARCKNPDALFVEASAERLPFGDGEFDGGIALFSVWSFVEPAVAARELSRVLKPGAPVLLMALNRTSLWRVLAGNTAPTDDYSTRGDQEDAAQARFYARAEFLRALMPYYSGRVHSLSWFGNVYQRHPLWQLDRLLCNVAPQLAHNLIFVGRRHA